MATSPDVTSMALFCDFENVALGVRDAKYEKFDIKPVLERLLLKGSIVVKKAYCDWDRYKGFKATMHEANFELIEIPHVRQSGKNSADIRLVVDALDLCYTKSHVNTFVIISGDSDFSPLVSKLRENNKQVIGVGVKQSTSDLLIANCDEFIFYDDLVRESGRQSSRREARPAPAAEPPAGHARRQPEENRRREEADARRTKGVEMALETFEALYAERGDGGKIWASVLKEAIKRRKPDFSESYYGFRSFGDLLEEMQARGFLKMGRDEKSNAFVFRNGGGESSASANADAAPAAPEVLPVTHRAGETEAREPRGRGTRSRGGRAGAAKRHDFEPTLAVEPPPRRRSTMRTRTRTTTTRPSASPTRRAPLRRNAPSTRRPSPRPMPTPTSATTAKTPTPTPTPTPRRRARPARAAAAVADEADAVARRARTPRRRRRRSPTLRRPRSLRRPSRPPTWPRSRPRPPRRPRRRAPARPRPPRRPPPTRSRPPRRPPRGPRARPRRRRTRPEDAPR